MAKNQKNQAAAIRFGPALKALMVCLLIAGSALGYVWQKSQIGQVEKQIRTKESQLKQVQQDNKILMNQLSSLQSVVSLGQRARGMGLVPAQPAQVVWLPEPSSTSPENAGSTRQFAARRADGTTP